MQRQRLCRLRAFLPSYGARCMSHELAEAKSTLRTQALARRAGLGSLGAAAALARHALPLIPPGATVAGFWPMGDEIDIRPMLLALHARGQALLLPLTPPRGAALRFLRWAPGDPLLPGRFGTRHPAGTDAATPDLLLVPLLAFDARGHRLGYGGGYYDRTLADLPRARRIGVAYAGQQVPSVPAGPHDIALHAIATEERVVAVACQD